MSTESLPAPAGAEAIQEAAFYIPATGPASRPRRTLKHGDRIRIGRSEFLFLIEAGDVNFEPKPDAHGPIAEPSRPSSWTGTTAEMSSTDFLDLT